jgi:hypothetical protein
MSEYSISPAEKNQHGLLNFTIYIPSVLLLMTKVGGVYLHLSLLVTLAYRVFV